MANNRPHDLCVRLGEKKYIKTQLLKYAKKNGLTLQTMIIYALEWFLEERKDREFTIKLR